MSGGMRSIRVSGSLFIFLAGALCAAAAVYGLVAQVTSSQSDSQLPGAIRRLQPTLSGESIEIPEARGFSLRQHSGGSLMSSVGGNIIRSFQIDLCQQRAGTKDDPLRIIPLRIGYSWKDVEGWIGANRKRNLPPHFGLRNIMLDSGAPEDDIPAIEITGRAKPGGLEGDAPEFIARLESPAVPVAVISDADGGHFRTIDRGKSAELKFRKLVWLIWNTNATERPRETQPASAFQGTRALRITRHGDPACDAGGLTIALLDADSVIEMDLARVTLIPALGRIESLRLAPGSYALPQAPIAALEDRALFENSVAQGLIRLSADGSIQVAPRDLLAWSALDASHRLGEPWRDTVLDDTQRKLLRHLYAFSDGAYVRQQVSVFNDERWISAIRLRTTDSTLSPASRVAGNWEILVDGKLTPVTRQVPPWTIRLFDEIPVGGGTWVRPNKWPASASPRTSVVYRIPLDTPMRGGERVDAFVLGQLVSVRGARLLVSPRPVCVSSGCANNESVQQVSLALEAGAQSLEIEAHPALKGSQHRDFEFRHIHLRDGKLGWQEPDFRSARHHDRAEVFIADRHGVPLWGQGQLSSEARESGLAALIGVSAEQETGIASTLARMGSAGRASVRATLTLDSGIQRLANHVLDCVGYRGGTWSGERCNGAKPVPAGRRGGLVLMDAGSGEILAAAGAPLPPRDAQWEDLRDFDNMNPAQSPLRVHAWQHDGGPTRAAGSIFKLVTALGLELAAKEERWLDELLDGRSPAEINRLALARGDAFDIHGACYPGRCDNKTIQVRNYRDQIPANKTSGGLFGLREAIANSLNTWFAWSYGLTDKTLLGSSASGVPDVFALDGRALDSLRPALAMAHRLGFERPMKLDGGLLPPDFPLGQWNVLQTTTSRFDPIQARHQLRQFAIGLRMQVTPLQMAVVSASIGEGRIVTPRLLASLDDNLAKATRGESLNVRLDRIRAGMKAVVDHGTARGAFTGEQSDTLRKGVYGKTGTAPLQIKVDGTSVERNTVWFTGWIEPGVIPGESRRLAFACFITQSTGTGGGHAAPVVVALINALTQYAHLQHKD